MDEVRQNQQWEGQVAVRDRDVVYQTGTLDRCIPCRSGYTRDRCIPEAGIPEIGVYQR